MRDDYDKPTPRRVKVRTAYRAWLHRRRGYNAVCPSCGYQTFQPRWRNAIGWNACPGCWEEGGQLETVRQPIRLSMEGRIARARGRMK